MASRLLRPTNLALANAVKKVQYLPVVNYSRFYRRSLLHKHVDIVQTT